MKSQRILKNFLRSKNSPFDASKGIVGLLIFFRQIRCFSRFCIKEYWQRYRSSFPLQGHDKSGKIHCFNHLKNMYYWLLMNKHYFSNNIKIFVSYSFLYLALNIYYHVVLVQNIFFFLHQGIKWASVLDKQNYNGSKGHNNGLNYENPFSFSRRGTKGA